MKHSERVDPVTERLKMKVIVWKIFTGFGIILGIVSGIIIERLL
jgi:hypothetical protein